MPQPNTEIGSIVEALAKAGVFRLRGVLVGTVAYQTYSAMLGSKLPISILQTGDVDIAQFKNVSVAVNDQTPPVLDVLIRDPEPAVILHGAGVCVNVPASQRFAVHKLMIARRRREGAAKRDKDVQQAEALLSLLLKKRRHELKSAWEEAYKRGKEWRRLLSEGLDDLSSPVRDEMLGAIAAKPSV